MQKEIARNFNEQEKEIFAKAYRLINENICKKYDKDNCKKCPITDCNFMFRLKQIELCGA
jgi:hypothetical protein